MRLYSADEVAEKLPYEGLVESLRAAFAQNIHAPLRSLYAVNGANHLPATLGLMPAWQAGGSIAAKILTIFPDNASLGIPTIHAQILLFDGKTGVPTAVIDGTEVTRRRTAAASALAATYLANPNAKSLLLIGTGAQAVHQALALSTVRPIERIQVWGRSVAKATAIVQAISRQEPALLVESTDTLELAARTADIISCVTSASEPILFGEWLKPGAFIDLVGSHMPGRRECDDETVRRSRIYVDTLTGALAEAGDLLIPIRSGVIAASDIVGDLHGLCRNEIQGRGTAEEITLFKSVGSGLEDLAAACQVASETHEV